MLQAASKACLNNNGIKKGGYLPFLPIALLSLTSVMNRLSAFRHTSVLVGVVCLAMLWTHAASAEGVDLGDVANHMRSQVTSISVFVTIFSFVIGIAMAMAGLLKLKEYSDNPRDPSNSITGAIIMFLAAAAFVALPSTLGMGVSSIFGDDAEVTNATTGFSSLN